MSDEKAIFTEALAIATPEERQAFLDRACGDNAALRAEVEALLAAHERAASFLESPTRGLPPTGAPNNPALDLSGATIGHYKLLERIGEGGMGVVYMAEQLRPVKRRVALKIIKPGLDTKHVIARFEAERQALAMMDHPSIAKVFDAGTTDTGASYFVMELVRGVPITEYCDQHQLTPRQRLELFVQVCQAVQHAHQKGIIHRDLKPTNVLVTLDDGDKPIPKIIDFGIAKATGEQRLTDHTLFTEFRQLIGTPLYMSPEQAEMSHIADVDTRSDVYSLGVLLYELLTGTTPFDKQRLAKAAYDEVRRIIREEEPPRPSTRLSTLGQTITSISAQRQTDPKKLSQTVRGELDWIVMKSLEKERARRYETANGLARDVERYLSDQPVEACPPSRVYRLRKFARRNKPVIVVTAVIAFVLVVATGFSAWQAVRATRAKSAALAEKQRADRAAITASNVAECLGQALQSAADPASGGGNPATALQLLNRAAERLEGRLADQPEVEASLQMTIGRIYDGIGSGDDAERHLARAMELYRRLYGDQDERYANVLIAHAWALMHQSDDGNDQLAKAEIEMRKAITILRIRGTDGPQVTDALATLKLILRGEHKTGQIAAVTSELLGIEQTVHDCNEEEALAEVAMEQADYVQAEAHYRRELRQELFKPGPAHGYAAWVYGKLSGALAAQHKYAEAIDATKEALSIHRLVSRENHWSVGGSLDAFTRILLSCRRSSALAATFPSAERLDDIESSYWQSVVAKRKRYAIGNDPATAAAIGLAVLVRIDESLSRELAAAGKAKEARAAHARALKLFDEIEERLPHDPELRAAAYPELMMATKDLGRPAGADELAAKSLAISSASAQSLNDMAWDMVASADPAALDAAMAVRIAERATAVAPADGNIWHTLGVAGYRAGDYAKSIEALGKCRQLQGDSSFALDAFFLAMAHWQLGHKAVARNWQKQAIAWMDTNRPHDPELLRFRAEADALINPPGQSGLPTTTTPAPAPQP